MGGQKGVLVREGRSIQSGLVCIPIRLESLLGSSPALFGGTAGTGGPVGSLLGVFQVFLFSVQFRNLVFHIPGLPGQLFLFLLCPGGRPGMVGGAADRTGLSRFQGLGQADGFTGNGGHPGQLFPQPGCLLLQGLGMILGSRGQQLLQMLTGGGFLQAGFLQDGFCRIQLFFCLQGAVVDGVELLGFFQPFELLFQLLDGRTLRGESSPAFLTGFPALEQLGQLPGLLKGFLGCIGSLQGLPDLGFQGPAFGCFYLQPVFQLLRLFYPGTFQQQVVPAAAVIVLLLQGLGTGIQGIFQGAVLSGLEQGLQDSLPFFGIRHQEPAEFTLGQDHQLAKLPGLETQQARCLFSTCSGVRVTSKVRSWLVNRNFTSVFCPGVA